MSRPVARFRSSRRYLLFALIALAGAALSLWSGIQWSPASWRVISYVASAGFAASGLAILAVFFRPGVEIHEAYLQIGARAIPWTEIRQVDQTRWLAPLATAITLVTGERFVLVYAGDVESSASLLRHLRRYSRAATLDGVPYRQFWGEPAPRVEPPAASHSPLKAQSLRQSPPAKTGTQTNPPARYPVLRPEEEEEVERLFQRLKTEGRLDQHSDEKIGEK